MEEHTTAEHVEDNQPTEQVVIEEVLTDAQEMEAPSDPFVDSSNASIKASV
jgi:hypothetical protein